MTTGGAAVGASAKGGAWSSNASDLIRASGMSAASCRRQICGKPTMQALSLQRLTPYCPISLPKVCRLSHYHHFSLALANWSGPVFVEMLTAEPPMRSRMYHYG